MAEIKFEKEWLDQALSQCAAELTDMLKSESALIKSDDRDDDAPAESSSGSSGPTSPVEDSDGGDAPPAESSAPADGPPEGSAPPGADAGAPPPGAEASAPADGAAPGQEQAIEPAPTVEALQAEYMKLDPETLKMHYLAAKSALAAAMGAEQGGAPGAPAPEASAPPAGPPAGAPPGPPAGAPMAMGEMGAGKQVKLTDGNGGEVEAGKLGKAEKEIGELRKQLDAQNAALLQLAEVVATPIRKSVKGLSDLKFIERTEESKPAPKALSKKEIQAALSAKVREGKLSKADKELVTQYTVGVVDFTKIEHLLASAK